jgi:hypothetical protein
MIKFLTLFLGIVAGPQEVALLVDEQIARVELRLDGEALTETAEPPWEMKIDLGSDLLPHVLEAVGFDEQGEEIARSTQRLNVPRPSAEISLALHHGPGDRLEARFAWENASGTSPVETIALLDEKEIAILDGGRVDLTGVDTRVLHVLQVELWFADMSSARGHLVFGGEYVDETSAELTAFPVALAKGEPKKSQMGQLFVSAEKPLRATALEKGLANVMVVRGPGVAGLIRSISGRPQSTPKGQSGALGPIADRSEATTAEVLRSGLPIPKDCRIRIVVPQALEASGRQVDFDLFSVSPEIRSKQGGMYWALSQDVQVAGVASGVRVQDAVTLAGLAAAGSNHRRAVLLILAGPWEDYSRFDVAAVRAYLDALNVPLVVWHLVDAGQPTGDWGPMVEISSYGDLKRAWRAVEKRLGRQRIVWIEGIHLPNAIQIAQGAALRPVVDDN